jgi:hypothetical protein
MAIARCKQCGHPEGKLAVYSTTSHLPVGHSNSGIVCGTPDCNNPGLVWLLDWEEHAYRNGQRIFELTGKARHAKFIVL